VAPLQPDAEVELPDFNSDNSGDSHCDEWNEEFIADAETEVAEEVAQWGEEQQVHCDPEKAAILASFNAQLFWRPLEEHLEYGNDTNFKHTADISRQRVTTEEASHLIMASERQQLLEFNAQCQAKAATREQARLPRTRSLTSGWRR
jgi:hypothetical protein